MDLNVGGLIGALVAGAVAGVIVFTTVDLENAGRNAYRLPIYALIGGAVAGNFLWSKLFPRDEESEPDDEMQ